MQAAAVVAQLVIGLGIFNVWVLRRRKASAWRAGGATSLSAEFGVYGFPPWFMTCVGALKLLCAALLITGIGLPFLVRPAAIGLAALMVGAIVMHARVGDPPRRSLPAATLLVLCLFVVLTSIGGPGVPVG